MSTRISQEFVDEIRRLERLRMRELVDGALNGMLLGAPDRNEWENAWRNGVLDARRKAMEAIGDD